MALITITAGIGCGGSEIARRVAEGLGIPLYDDETLRKESIALGLSPKELKSLDEKAPGFLSRVLELHPSRTWNSSKRSSTMYPTGETGSS